jgi:RNA polymerase sigma-70 factor (ECF subfamily)
MQRFHFFVVFTDEASAKVRGYFKMDDEMILDLYWARSESAISETAKKYGSYCIRIAANILRNNEDAEECVNDTYHKAWDAIPPQRPSNFRAFLGRITRNLSLNRYKEQKTQKRGGDNIALIYSELEECIPSNSSVETEYESGIIVEAINSFLLTLDKDSRIIFVRRYWHAEPIQAIAACFRMSDSKVKSMLFRTRKKLRAYLENEGVIL